MVKIKFLYFDSTTKRVSVGTTKGATKDKEKYSLIMILSITFVGLLVLTTMLAVGWMYYDKM